VPLQLVGDGLKRGLVGAVAVEPEELVARAQVRDDVVVVLGQLAHRRGP
jgi:hypothetical protein